MAGLHAVVGAGMDLTGQAYLPRWLPWWRGEVTATLRGEDAVVSIQSTGVDAEITRDSDCIVALHGFISSALDVPSGARTEDGWQPNSAACIARVFRDLGVAGLSQLRGEFALVLYDEREKVLLLCRDSVGTRPLFFLEDGALLRIATDARSLAKDSNGGLVPDIEGIRSYLRWSPDGDRTNYEAVRRVFPGCAYVFGRQSGRWVESRTEVFPSPVARQDVSEKTVADWCLGFHESFETAVRRCFSGARVAVCLSGGLDSSAILSTAVGMIQEGTLDSEVLPITLRFPGLACDEGSIVAATLRQIGIEGIEENAPVPFPSNLIERTVEAVSTVPYAGGPIRALLARLAREHGCSRMVSGHGGDEWFTGETAVIQDLASRGDFPDALAFVRLGIGDRIWYTRGVLGHLWRGLRQYCRGVAEFTGDTDAARRLPSAKLPGDGLLIGRAGEPEASAVLTSLQRRLSANRAERYFEQAEQISAREGVMVRSPYVDQDLMRFALSVPGDVMFSGRIRKGLVRRAMRGRLPTELLLQRHRIGIGPGLVAAQADVAESVERSKSLAGCGLISHDEVARVATTLSRRGGAGVSGLELVLLERFSRRFALAGYPR